MNQSENTIAVITAAITAFLGSNTGIAIKSIRRVPEKGNAWVMSGRGIQIRTWTRR